MRRIHRTLGLFFSPFLIISAVTGLLWAYAPYLYLKQEPKKEKLTFKASNITLYSEDGKAVHAISFPAKDVTVDNYSVMFQKPDKKNVPVFHQWVMRLHQFQFFGTKKELTAFPGVGLVLMLVTGLFLFKRGLK